MTKRFPELFEQFNGLIDSRKRVEYSVCEIVTGALFMFLLFEQKLLREFRFLGKYYFVAVDATGTHTFDHEHCEHCLTKTSKNGITT